MPVIKHLNFSDLGCVLRQQIYLSTEQLTTQLRGALETGNCRQKRWKQPLQLPLKQIEELLHS
ncbi:hypothetical protein NIES37_52660 [Tolypothrix tenuis PCC 7101]|uniref:Uncharacterized protein n=1 Tax=Tolypothrix tenuis PCC 7101 TaxID=231146 RepID=A0A1Z4N6D4_9CYAN|nr:hypothetical protein [Aulosira sp. FACHB-113]BAZ01267.1 hypothetical protein NIES37_52660 [Tolypothrix tenuis PCC 7101]BAZ74810.1 hypothetical protein NIES50_33890 [Aulosira laxa NIES-50]